MIDWNSVKVMAAEYLSELIQIDTSKRNEMVAVNWLKNKAEQHGVFTFVQTTADNRGNIIISLKPDYHQPIVLLSHLDVVPAKEEDWEIPPFSGAIINDVIWGRGTIDTKQLTITHLLVLILIKEYRLNPQHDVILIATSDEENGSQFGLLALLNQYATLFNGSIVFNEGGGFPILIGDQAYYLCEMGQKGRAVIKISAQQEQIENPYLPNNSSLKTMTKTIERFQSTNLIEQVPAISQLLMKTIVKQLNITDKITSDLFLEHIPVHLRSLFKAMTKSTFSITRWSGGRKHPTLSGNSEIYIDCRTLPSVTYDSLQHFLAIIVKDLPVQVEILEFSQGYEMGIKPKDLLLFETILKNKLPNAKILPFLSIGGSDSRHLYRLDTQVYGYCPMLPDMTFDRVIKMVHGPNESLPLDSLLFGIQNMVDIVTTIERSAEE
jgi:acetylornithine deacetylase/succinyl-diaminopimelate desuccinylase-like protein